MELKEKIKSSLDKTVKYVFRLNDGVIMETSYIDNGTGKDIICVSSQTMCSMGCSFCHLTDYVGKVKLRNMNFSEIIESVDFIYRDLNLVNNRLLLVSYMGMGEAVMNSDNVLISMKKLMQSYENIRFGMATSLPKGKWKNFIKIAEVVKESKIPLKIHLSLHYTRDLQRNEFMPGSLNIKPSISALEFYHQITGNPVEIHYTLIKGQNDTIEDSWNLISLIENREIPVKFLRFSPKENDDNEETDKKRISYFREKLEESGIKTEYYEPPGFDVAASCGMFLMENYLP